MTRLDKILNKVSDFLVTLQKLTSARALLTALERSILTWGSATEDVRLEHVEKILPKEEKVEEQKEG